MLFSRIGLILSLGLLLAGCASIIGSATRDMANNLSLAILNQDDPQTVRDGAPAYLIMIDSFVAGNEDSSDMLRAAAKLYGAYATTFVKDQTRAQRLARKSLDYAQRALCIEINSLCNVTSTKTDELQQPLAQISTRQQPVLYDFAGAWAGWIQVNSGDWNALAQVPKLQAMLQRSIALDESYDRGGAHLYLGVLASQIPPSLGGKPEVGRAHFERAQQLADGKSLMVNVLFAEHYARLVFDQELHDRLLQEVIETPPDQPGLTLMNVLAQERAEALLAESGDYF